MDIGRLHTYTHPFTGKLVTTTKCGLCSAPLPIPGTYPLLLVENKPDETLHDLTGSQPIQGFRIVRPVCWHHTQ